MRIQSLIVGFKGLKGLCHEDTTVFLVSSVLKSVPDKDLEMGGGGGHLDP